MDIRAEKNIKQLANDAHFLTAPVRLIWHFIIIFVLVFLSAPVVFSRPR